MPIWIGKLRRRRFLSRNFLTTFGTPSSSATRSTMFTTRRITTPGGLPWVTFLDNTNAKALFISATPISNSQNEIVSVVNLLAGKGRKYNLRDFLDGGESSDLTPKGARDHPERNQRKDFLPEEYQHWGFSSVGFGWVVRSPGSPTWSSSRFRLCGQEHLQLYKPLLLSVVLRMRKVSPEEGVESSIGFRNDCYLKSAQGKIVGSVTELSAYSKTKPPG